MKHSISKTVIIAAALLLSASLSFAAETKPGPAGEVKAISHGKAAAKSGKAKVAKATAKPRFVDINSASKAELMKLPGISAAEADKIIAGRPFNTKARLVTNKIITMGAYQNIKQLIIARQK